MGVSVVFPTHRLPLQNVAEVLQLIRGVTLDGRVVVANQPAAPAVLAPAERRMQLGHSQPPISRDQAGTPLVLAGPISSSHARLGWREACEGLTR